MLFRICSLNVFSAGNSKKIMQGILKKKKKNVFYGKHVQFNRLPVQVEPAKSEIMLIQHY